MPRFSVLQCLRWVCPIVVLSMATETVAQTIYRSVDKDGNVTYSSTPPSDAQISQPVELAPGPTQAQQAQARERQREMESTADDMAREREAKADTGPPAEPTDLPTDEMPGHTVGVGGVPSREEVAEEAKRRAEERLGEGAEPPVGQLPRGPVTIQPVPSPGGDLGGSGGEGPARKAVRGRGRGRGG